MSATTTNPDNDNTGTDDDHQQQDATTDELTDAISKLEIQSTTTIIPEPSPDPSETPEPDSGSKHHHQSYFNWIQPEQYEDGGATTDQIMQILQDRFIETKSKDAEAALQYNTMELIADKGTLCYTYSLAGAELEAKVALAEARDFIQTCSKKKFLAEDYLIGFDYVFDALEFYMDTNDNKVEKEKTDDGANDWSSLQSYQELNPKSKAAVLAIKFYFYRQLRKNVGEQVDLVDQMITLDPNYGEWHFCKATILRYERQFLPIVRDVAPNPELYAPEAKEIVLAKTLAPNHPQYMLSYCHLLAEMSKRLKPRWDDWKRGGPLRFGGDNNKDDDNVEEGEEDEEKEGVFYSIDQVAGFLKKECLKILNMYNQSVRVNTTIADIFMKWLPKKFRDLDLAGSCLHRALSLHPKSSKANHRLASYYLSITPPVIEKAAEHCALAHEYDPRNFPSLAELIQILLGAPIENELRIMELLDKYLVNTSQSQTQQQDHVDDVAASASSQSMASVVQKSLSDQHKSELLFYKGLLYFKLSDELGRVGADCAAGEAWITAQRMSGTPLKFDWLMTYSHDRYQWPSHHFDIHKFRSMLIAIKSNKEFMMVDGDGAEDKEAGLALLFESLTNAEEAVLKYGGFRRNNRGGGGGRGGGDNWRGRGNSRGGDRGRSRGTRGNSRGRGRESGGWRGENARDGGNWRNNQ